MFWAVFWWQQWPGELQAAHGTLEQHGTTYSRLDHRLDMSNFGRHKKAMNQQLGSFSSFSVYMLQIATGRTWMNCKRTYPFQRPSKALGHGLVLWAVWSIDNLGYMDGWGSSLQYPAASCSNLQQPSRVYSPKVKGVPWMCRLLIPSPMATRFKLLLACLSADVLRWMVFLLFPCNKLVRVQIMLIQTLCCLRPCWKLRSQSTEALYAMCFPSVISLLEPQSDACNLQQWNVLQWCAAVSSVQEMVLSRLKGEFALGKIRFWPLPSRLWHGGGL